MSINIEQTLQTAITHHGAGRFREAEALYRQILTAKPNFPPALHLLGVAASQQGNKASGVELISKAIALSPNVAEFHSNLALVFLEDGRPEQAVISGQRSIQLNPREPGAQFILANAWRDIGRTDEAIAGYQ